MQNIQSNSGGAAMAGGQRYQARVTAWWAARILLQTPIGDAFDLPPSTIPERIGAETQDAVDDLRVNLFNGHLLYGQCKTSLSLSSSLSSEWAGVLIQFYRELQRPVSTGIRRFFVLYYERNNENLNRLSIVLNRYRNLPEGSSLSDAAFNQAERTLVTNLELLLEQIQSQGGNEDLQNCREDLLRHTFIKQLQLEPGSPANLEIITSFQQVLLHDISQIQQVFTLLHYLADDLLADRGSRDRLALRRMLDGRGVRLRGSISYRGDYERLEQWSRTEIGAHYAESRHKLVIHDHEAVINRSVVEAIVNAARTESFLVVGDAGVGKTGCLLSAVNQLRNEGYRVWYWSADSLPYNSSQEIGIQLGLEHTWQDLFEEATSAELTVLVIDGLDGLRESNAQRAYRNLLRQAKQLGIKVISSVRTFDLLYSVDLKNLFSSGNQPLNSNFYNLDFSRVKHIYIKELTGQELEQALEQLPQLVPVLENAPQLNRGVANLFSLDLLCKLINDGETSEVFSAISTQADLFSRFWEQRIDNNQLTFEVTEALTRLVEQMVYAQNLQVSPEPGALSGAVRATLSSAGFLRNPPAVPGRIQESNLVEFTHHLMFDYVVEKLYLRPKRRTLAQELAPLNSSGLFIRPSLRLFFLYLWRNGRNEFWDTLISLQQAGWTVFQKLPASLTVAQEAMTYEDVQPLLNGSFVEGDSQECWRRSLQEIISAASFSKVPELLDRGFGDSWLEFARDLINTSIPQLVYGGAHLLNLAFFRFNNLSSTSKTLFHEGAISMVKFHLDSEFAKSPNIRLAVKWVCETFSLNPPESSAIIRRLISNQELQNCGYLTTPEITDQLESIWALDPELVVDIYDAVFSYVESDQSTTSVTNDLILNITSTRAQDYAHSWWSLTNKFPAFLEIHPADGTRALIRIFRQINLQPQHREEAQIEYFLFENRQCTFLRNHLGFYRSTFYIGNDRNNILASYQRFLEGLIAQENGDQIWNEVADVLVAENEIGTIWNAVLESGSKVPQFFSIRLWTMLKNSSILASNETFQGAKSCLSSFPQYLDEGQIDEIETAIIGLSSGDYPNQSTENAEEYAARTKAKLLALIPENRHGSLGQNFINNIQSHFPSPRAESIYPSAINLDDELSTNHQKNLELMSLVESLPHSPITQELLPELILNIRRIEGLLDDDDVDLNPLTKEHIFNRLIACFKNIVSCELQLDREVISQAYKIFTQKLNLPSRSLAEQNLNNFAPDSSESINSYQDAAHGFIRLAIREEELSDEIREMLQRLAHDPQPFIRFDVGQWMWMLLDKWQEFVWETVERYVSELTEDPDTHHALLGALSRNSWFWYLRSRDQERAERLLDCLTTAAKSFQALDILRTCGILYANLSIFLSDDSATFKITTMCENVRENLSELGGALQVASDTIFPKEINENFTTEHKARAVNFIVVFFNQANAELNAFFERHNSIQESEREKKSPQWVKTIMNHFDHLARIIQVSAEQINKVESEERETEAIKAKINEWWENSEPIMNKLLDMPYPQFAYHLLEAITHVTWSDGGRRGMPWLRRITMASAPLGLTVHQVAADKTIQILENVLADHISLPAGSELRDDFIQVLEAYLQIGWARAMHLAIKLDSMLR